MPSKRDSAPAIRVMLVDDHPLWRDTLRKVLEHAGCTIVATAEDGNEAIVAAQESRPDVVVMDVNLPTLDGIEATKTLRQLAPGARVLALSSSDEPSSVVGIVRAGATGYLVKTAGAAEVSDAVRRVYAGELVFPSEISALVLAELRGETGDPTPREVLGRPAKGTGLDALTSREREVLALMAEGRSNQAICERLFLNPKSVESHVRNIFTKLGLEPAPDDHRRVLAVITFLRAHEAIPPE